eukprot:scaffold27360_cov53-Prasinocladus_malaysianus.AAC.1
MTCCQTISLKGQGSWLVISDAPDDQWSASLRQVLGSTDDQLISRVVVRLISWTVVNGGGQAIRSGPPFDHYRRHVFGRRAEKSWSLSDWSVVDLSIAIVKFNSQADRLSTSAYQCPEGPFIFSPLDARESPERRAVRWVCGEECEVYVEVLEGPLSPIVGVRRQLFHAVQFVIITSAHSAVVRSAIPVRCQSVWSECLLLASMQMRHNALPVASFLLQTTLSLIEEAGTSIPYPKPDDYSRWKGNGVTVWLPAQTQPSKLALTGLAKVPGRLVITGCYIQMFGVTWHQPWTQKGSPGATRASLPAVLALKLLYVRQAYPGYLMNHMGNVSVCI